MTEPPSPEEWADFVQQAQAEGQSLWTVEIFTPEDMDDLLLDAMAGNEDAARWVPMIGRMMRQMQAVQRPNRKKSPLCLLCDTLFWRRQIPRAFVFLVPKRDDPERTLASGICRKCRTAHTTLPELRNAVLATYRARLLPDLRELWINNTPGHA